MSDAIEFKAESVDIPVSINIDTDIGGAFFLARLCQLAYELYNEDQVLDIYSQIVNQIEQYGSYVTLDSEDDSND